MVVVVEGVVWCVGYLLNGLGKSDRGGDEGGDERVLHCD